MNEDVRPEWYVFFTWRGEPAVKIETTRISASCLGDAVEVAKQITKTSNLYLIGVAPDLGVKEG